MTPKRLGRGRASLVATALLVTACVPDGSPPDHAARAFLRIVAAEDERPAGGPALETLLAGAEASDASLRTAAVRALGRLEEPRLVGVLAPRLADPSPRVRAEAANALAQAVHRGSGEAALAPLLDAAEVEGDPDVAAAIARSLGRLEVPEARADGVERALVALSRRDDDVAPVLGAVLGMESWTRLNGASAGAVLRARVAQLAAFSGRDADAVRLRSIALVVAARLGTVDASVLARALADPDAAVRAAAAAGTGRLQGTERASLGERALGDPSSRVRTEAIRVLAAGPRDPVSCARLRAATGDTDARAAGLAIDALARPCADPAATVALLERLAGSLGGGPAADWHRGAHALLALAALAPPRARPLLGPALRHPNAFARAYAARAAGLLGERASLLPMLGDPDSNVASQAAAALANVGAGDDDALIGLLGATDDAQVVVTTAPLLHATALRGPASEAALATLGRLTEARMQTLRDPRLALLDLIEATADTTRLRNLEPYLRDFDPAVAMRAASVMETWTGKRFLGAPRPTARLPLPTPAELRAMEASSVVLHMARGGEIEIALLPLEATTNAFRFYTLARDGALDGLTLHRVVPNFVVQGGSPRANEYGGHGAFTRDEVGLRVQWRGTVGVSTRGRDTGDGQIYVNLVDNVRLDHDYTLLGMVASGMDVVDRVLEGDVIERAEVRSR